MCKKTQTTCIECGLNKTKWVSEERSSIQHSGSVSPFSLLSLSEGRRGGENLMATNKGDLHKQDSGSPAAVVNKKASASRHPY